MRVTSGLKFLTLASGLMLCTRSTPAAEDMMARSRAAYAAMNSYSDTGIIEVEYGRDSRDRHTFATLFNRSPRGFLLDFNKDGGDRYVVWGDPDAFHTWWKSTTVREDYPNPSNTGAFTMAGPQTKGASEKIPSLLYGKAPLPSAFANFTDGRDAGTESIGGKTCAKLTGTAYDTYTGTGRRTSVRRMTVWIDSESLLIRKIVEEGEAPPGMVNRITTTYEPNGNLPVDAGRFRFAPPAK